jgi:hypothetical protein
MIQPNHSWSILLSAPIGWEGSSGEEKCGSKIQGSGGQGEDTEEYILRLDLDQANQ